MGIFGRAGSGSEAQAAKTIMVAGRGGLVRRVVAAMVKATVMGSGRSGGLVRGATMVPAATITATASAGASGAGAAQQGSYRVAAAGDGRRPHARIGDDGRARFDLNGEIDVEPLGTTSVSHQHAGIDRVGNDVVAAGRR
jgi:hypothetical protein